MQVLEKQRNLRQRFQNIRTMIQADVNKPLQISVNASDVTPFPTRSTSVSPSRIVQLNTPNPNDKPLTTSTPKEKVTLSQTVEAAQKVTPALPSANGASNDVKQVEPLKKPTQTAPLTIEDKLAKMSEAARDRMLDRSENAFGEHRYHKTIGVRLRSYIPLLFFLFHFQNLVLSSSTNSKTLLLTLRKRTRKSVNKFYLNKKLKHSGRN